MIPLSVIAQGNATSSTNTTLVDSAATWGVGEFVGLFVDVRGNSSQLRRIISNTATTITIDSAWASNPTAGTLYFVYALTSPPTNIRKGKIAFGTVINTSTPAFGANITTDSLSPVKMRVQAAFSNASSVLNVTLDGTNYAQVNQASALVQNGVYLFDIMMDNDDALNFEVTGSNGTVIFFRVYEIIGQG